MDLIEKHSFLNDTVFRLKTTVLTGSRLAKNLFQPVKKHRVNNRLTHEPVIALSESELWNPHDNADNWILTAGKIHNLRIAAGKINGLEVKANEVFSFWRHIGNPNFGQGFVVGREIREGCIVPTVAGGLCQLSNALYDAALKANFDILERHRHTRVIKGSLAEQDRDATVKWNYVDLRFHSSSDFRIEAELTGDKLMVRFRAGKKTKEPENDTPGLRHTSQLNDCYSCGNFNCYKHPGETPVKPETASTTFILDEKWPEFDSYVKTLSKENDLFLVPMKKGRFVKTDRYTWTSMKPGQTRALSRQGWYRAIRMRYAPKQNNIFERSLQLDRNIAFAAARRIPVDSTHLVVSQNLLPFLYETGALGGRTYDVLMTRLPMEKLHERLDMAHSKHPESATLNDFRAPQHLIDMENKALTRAGKVVSPHTEIASLFNNKTEKLDWHMPAGGPAVKGNKLLFPASALGRKGAYEIRALAKELDLTISVAGRTLENDRFWEGVSTEKFNGDYDQVGLIIYPAYVEHQPRQILKALSKGIPLITTTACGLEPSEQVSVVETGNFEQLKEQVKVKVEVEVEG